jgi:hypothetical protein
MSLVKTRSNPTALPVGNRLFDSTPLVGPLSCCRYSEPGSTAQQWHSDSAHIYDVHGPPNLINGLIALHHTSLVSPATISLVHLVFMGLTGMWL